MSSTTAAPSLPLAAEAWLDANGLPNRHLEAWKYTPIDEIAARLSQVLPAPEEPPTVDVATIDELAGRLGGIRLVFVNGRYSNDLSELSEHAGVTISGDTSPQFATDPADTLRYDGYQALNHMADADTALILLDDGIRLETPIHVVHLTTPMDQPVLMNPRTVVRAGAGSQAHIVESFVSISGPLLVNTLSTFEVGEGASLSHNRIQNESLDTLHVGHTRVEQATRSEFSSVAVMLGAKVARNALDVTLIGDYTESHLDGLYLPTGNQRHDNMLTIDHAGSHGRSDQNYKGVIGGRGRGSFSGHVIVRDATVDNDADQSNRNLLLASTAQVDSRPWLEIFADDVQCTHGATVGRLDEEALFYLRSRAIPLHEARSMLIAAFVHEISDEIEPTPLREHLLDSIDTRIGENK